MGRLPGEGVLTGAFWDSGHGEGAFGPQSAVTAIDPEAFTLLISSARAVPDIRESIKAIER